MTIQLKHSTRFLIFNLVLDVWILLGIFYSNKLFSLSFILLLLSHFQLWTKQKKFHQINLNLKQGTIQLFFSNEGRFQMELTRYLMTQYLIILRLKEQNAPRKHTIIITSDSQNFIKWRKLSYFVRHFSHKKVTII